MKFGVARVQKAILAAAVFERVKKHRVEIHPVDVATEEEHSISFDVVLFHVLVRDLETRPFQSEAQMALSAGKQGLLAERGQ